MLYRGIFKSDSNICIIGRRGTGISSIVKDILNNYSDNFISNSLIISPTEKLNKNYIKYLKAKVIYECDTEIIDGYLKNKADGAIVFDKCDMRPLNHEFILKLLSSNKPIIIAISFGTRFDQNIRNKFDYVFFMEEKTYTNQKYLYDNYGTIIPTFNMFERILLQLTDNYGSMVISNITNTIHQYKN